MSESYKNYTVIDFLLNEDFKNYVLEKEGTVSINNWDEILRTYPELLPIAEEARLQLIKLKSNIAIVDIQQDRSWDIIEKRILNQQEEEISQLRKRPNYWYYAASMLLILGIGGVLLFQKEHVQSRELITYSTAVLEQKYIVLPDSSLITLYPNSKLTYYPVHGNDEIRRVDIVGSASLEVKNYSRNKTDKAYPDRFQVHFNDSLYLEVLGTSFLVQNFKEEQCVSLQSGSVKLYQGKNSQLMKPGETIKVHSQEPLTLVKSKFNYSDSANEITLNNASAEEVCLLLKNLTGVQVDLSEKNKLKLISGTLPLDNLDQCMQIIADILEAKAVKKGNAQYEFVFTSHK